MTKTPPPEILRPVYRDQQLLAVDDFTTEQNFHIGLRELGNRLLLTPGILDGLDVVKAADAPGGTTLAISPGVALDASGRLILLADRAKFGDQSLPLTGGRFLITLDKGIRDGKVATCRRRLTITFQEEPDEAKAEGRRRQVPQLALLEPEKAVPDLAVLLGEIAISTVPAAPGTAGAEVRMEITAAARSTIAACRLARVDAGHIDGVLGLAQMPELPVAKLAGAIPAGRIDGVLNLSQVPELPIAKLAGAIPAGRIDGVLNLSQVPELPIAKLTGAIPAGRIDGVLNLSQLPELPVAKLTGTIPARLVVGQFSADQIPDLPIGKIAGLADGRAGAASPDMLRRLGVLERRLLPQAMLSIGKDGFAHANDIPAYHFGGGEMAIAAVFRTGQPGTLISSKSTEGGASTRAGWLLTLQPGGAIKFATDDGFKFHQGSSAKTAALDGQVHCVVATRLGAELKVYLDGQLLPLTPAGAGGMLALSGTSRVVVGWCDQKQEDYRDFVGAVREVSLWRRALDDSEVIALMGGPPSPDAPGLVALWELNRSYDDRSKNRNPLRDSGNVSWP